MWSFDPRFDPSFDHGSNQRSDPSFAPRNQGSNIFKLLQMTKIATFNLNGIRAAVSKGFITWLKNSSIDILAIQETKAQKEQIPEKELNEIGYRVYSYSAEKKGYSGVAIICKAEPKYVQYGMGMEVYDREGRFLMADFGDTSLVCAYHPSGTSSQERQDFKMQWLKDFTVYVENLRKNRPNLILCGDYNICHEAIDIHDPIRNANSSGFLPEERQWMSDFLAKGYVDSFRHLHQGEKDKYTWWSYRTRARERNLGWRIDYIMLSQELLPRLKASSIDSEAVFSDHCPSLVEIDINI